MEKKKKKELQLIETQNLQYITAHREMFQKQEAAEDSR